MALVDFGSDVQSGPLRLEINSAKLERVLRTVPVAARQELTNAFFHIKNSFFTKFRKERLSGPPGVRGTRGGLFIRFRGQLDIPGRSFSMQVAKGKKTTIKQAETAKIGRIAGFLGEVSYERIGDMKITVYTTSKAAFAHEYGAQIGGSGKKLAIPLPMALTAGGNLKQQFRRGKGRTLEDVAPDLVPIKMGNDVFLVRFKGRGKEKEPIPFFILKNRIQIRPRLGFLKTWEAHRTRQIQILNSAVSSALKQAQEA